MSKTIHLTHRYDFHTDLVWNVATDLDHLKRVTQSLVTFRNLPSGQIFEGQDLHVDVSLFGKMPYQPYRMTVVEFDGVQRRFQSSEIGAGVKSWLHTLQITAEGDGCRIDETIEVDAGSLTPLFAAWAAYMYRKRHALRLAILKELSEPNASD